MRLGAVFSFALVLGVLIGTAIRGRDKPNLTQIPRQNRTAERLRAELNVLAQ
jgi:hypothetical protein